MFSASASGPQNNKPLTRLRVAAALARENLPGRVDRIQEVQISSHREANREASMSVEGIILHHGEAGGVTLHQIRSRTLVGLKENQRINPMQSKLPMQRVFLQAATVL